MTIWQEAESLKGEMIARRRDLHKYPEVAWTEFRTTALIATELVKLGYEVQLGDDIIVEQEMMGIPSKEELDRCAQRAINEGADPKLVAKMAGGKTGVMGVMHFAKPGKTVGLRFDIDCNEVSESRETTHMPYQRGFVSLHEGLMHACGHDGHVTIGLAAAKLIAAHKEEMAGTVKFFFQPGEEGVKGARAMVASGIADDVDYFLSGHVGFGCREDNALVCMTTGFLATTKLDAHFTGFAAHAGGEPEQGKNALLAAASATLALHAMPRHSGGASRINVGVLKAGTGRNVVPDVAVLKLETRGATTEVNEFLKTEAMRIIKGAAAMYDVQVSLEEVGGAAAAVSDADMGQEIMDFVSHTKEYKNIYLERGLGGSEDCSYFMERVQANGGKAVYMMYGSEIAAGHHNKCFDFHEETMWKTAATIEELVKYYGHKTL